MSGCPSPLDHFDLFHYSTFYRSVLHLMIFLKLRKRYKLNLYSYPEQTKPKACTVIVQLVLKYVSTLWYPHQATQLKKIEAIQRRAGRFVKRDYGNHSSVYDMLKWPALKERHYIARTCLFHFREHLDVGKHY